MDQRLFNSLSEDIPAAPSAGAAAPKAQPIEGGSLFAGEGVALSPSSFSASGISLMGGDATDLSPSSFVAAGTDAARGEATELSPSSFAQRASVRLDEGAATALSPSSFGQIEGQDAAGDPQAHDGRKRRGTA